MKFIHEHLENKLCDQINIVDEDYSYEKYVPIITDGLFKIFEDEMLHMTEKGSKNKEILKTLFKNVIDFRKNVFLEDSLPLNEAMAKLELEQMETSNLVLKFLNGTNLSNESIRGFLNFKCWKKNDNIVISLKNVSKLKPRPKKDNLDFTISLSIQPMGETKQKHKTEVVKNVTDHIFDMSENDNTEEHEFTLQNIDSEKFLQIVLYDCSQSYRKYFRGVCYQPLNEISAENSDSITFSTKFTTFPKITETHEVFPLWNELKSRPCSDEIAARIVKDIECFMFESYKFYLK